jgi:hypothetical protein
MSGSLIHRNAGLGARLGPLPLASGRRDEATLTQPVSMPAAVAPPTPSADLPWRTC